MALLCGVFCGSVAYASKVHLVIACDDTQESGLGGDVVADKAAIENVFAMNIPAQQLSTSKIDGKDLSPESMLAAVAALRVERRKDSVVFYYSGHGAFDPQVGHFFSLPGKKRLLRSRLEQAIVAKEPLSAITITDCCAAGMRYQGTVRPTKTWVKPSRISPLFERLLLGRSGLISVTSSEPYEVSITRGDGKGSLFTYSFAALLKENSQADWDWHVLLAKVTAQVKEDFTEVTNGKGLDTDGDGTIDQKTQTVHAFLITPRLGMRVREEAEGLRITQVVPLSPAFHAGLEVGDLLLEVNKVPIRTEQAYSAAVDNSPEIMTLKVRDHRTPRVVEATAHLNR